MIQQDTPTKKYVRIRFRGETLIRLIVNHKFAKHYNLTSTFGFGSQSSKSSPRRVPRETRATESCVALEVFSGRSAKKKSPTVLQSLEELVALLDSTYIFFRCLRHPPSQLML